ncbi:MAG: hypothetical protein K8R48_07600 [Alphaproteobacteria bacterium]|nr:hypothetical protein [Alphaproteobacteria bacterium]
MVTYTAPTTLANSSVTFKLNDVMLGGKTDTWCTVTQVNGQLVFKIWDTLGADLTGLFFDWADKMESGILNNFQITSDGKAPLGALTTGNDSVTNLGGGVTMDGLVSKADAFDAGMTVGLSGGASAGGVADLYSSVSFTMSSKDGTALDLSSVLNGLTIGVREQSVLDANGQPTSSAKIMETIDTITTAKNDVVTLTENTVSTTSVFANDGLTSATKAAILTWGIALKGEDGSAVTKEFPVGKAVGIGFGATAMMTADGKLVIDASGSDAMYQDQVANFTFFYTAQYTTGDMTSTFSAKVAVTLTGENDAPIITHDISLTADGAAASDNVLNYSTDIDNGAILAGYSLGGNLIDPATGEARVDLADSGGSYLTLNADGTVMAVAGDKLGDTTLTGSVKVAVIDEHGATAEANVTYTLVGHSNHAPTAVDDTIAALSGRAVGTVAGLMANDFDVDKGDVISFAGINGDGTTLQDLAKLDIMKTEIIAAPSRLEQWLTPLYDIENILMQRIPTDAILATIANVDKVLEQVNNGLNSGLDPFFPDMTFEKLVTTSIADPGLDSKTYGFIDYVATSFTLVEDQVISTLAEMGSHTYQLENGGTLKLFSDGSYELAIAHDAAGLMPHSVTDAFHYTIADQHGATSSAVVNTFNNIAPDAQDFTAGDNIDIGARIDFSAVNHAFDADGDKLAFSLVSEPLSGARVGGSADGLASYDSSSILANVEHALTKFNLAKAINYQSVDLLAGRSWDWVNGTVTDFLRDGSSATYNISDGYRSYITTTYSASAMASLIDKAFGLATHNAYNAAEHTINDSFTYGVNDGYGGTDAAKVYVTVNVTGEAIADLEQSILSLLEHSAVG